MTNDLEQRIADLAAAWDRNAAPVSVDDVTASAGRVNPSTTVEVVAGSDPSRRGHVMLWLGAAAAVAAVVVLAVRREPDSLDPVAPATSATTVTTVPASTVTTAAATVPTTIEATLPPTTAGSSTVVSTTLPAPMSGDDASAALAQLDAERTEALRKFTTIGFAVHRTITYLDGRSFEDGSPPAGTIHVVVRNDGSAAVASDSFGLSYFDAATGTARALYTEADGNPAYQEIVGQADSSVALGVSTGLLNGVTTSIAQLRDGFAGVTEDVIDGRPTWRVDQVIENLSIQGGPPLLLQTWIDRATGITVQTHSSGITTIGDTPVDETITLTGLEPGAPMPADFPNPFPADATVASSGDPTVFGPFTLQQAAAEFDGPLLLPSLPADQVSIERMDFGAEIAPVLHISWFDGFVRTELRIDQYPSMMDWPDTCTDCTISLLEELRAAPLTVDGVHVARDNVGITLTGDPDTIRAVIASLTDAS